MCLIVRPAEIDWRRLYADNNGYFLFEDLKVQWHQIVAPDYVLVDSRTGHTDVGGICTRQLPDAVVCLFFPNDQNLVGLKQIVHEIRREQQPPMNKHIHIHFVNSNVPDLDDEDKILKDRFDSFRHELGFDKLTATIHHYNSLALLNQVVFVEDRPRSRLAAEFRELTDQIIIENPEDRDGAIRYLNTLLDQRRAPASLVEDPSRGVSVKLDKIRNVHKDDGEILFTLGLVHRGEFHFEESSELFESAIKHGYRNSRVFLLLADINQSSGNTKQALELIKKALRDPNASRVEIHRAVRLLRQSAPKILSWLTRAEAIRAMDTDDLMGLVSHDLSFDDDSLAVGKRLLKRRIKDLSEDDSKADTKLADLNSALVLVLIGLGRPREAMRAISRKRPDPSALGMRNAFNYAMALWAASKESPIPYFRRVMELDRDDSEHRERDALSVNYNQCLAVASWLCEDEEAANNFLKRARNILTTRAVIDTSCWRYKVVGRPEFQEDLEAIEAFFTKGKGTPPFIAAAEINGNKNANTAP